MNLQFLKEKTKFVAEFEATGDFNLHLERPSAGAIYLQVRGTSQGKYDSVKNVSMSDADLIFDSDFTALVYPKYIRIVSDVEPTVAVVTFTASVEEALQSTIVSNLNTPV